MADTPITLDDIKKQQKVILDISAEFANTRDADEIKKITARINAATAQFNELLAKLKAQADQQLQEAYASGKAAPPRSEVVEIVLTPEQITRVKAATGVHMETVLLPDPGGSRSITMPITTPPEVEAMAIEQANQRKAEAEALAKAKATAQAAVADYEKEASPEAKALLEKAKQDPNFLAGLLK